MPLLFAGLLSNIVASDLWDRIQHNLLPVYSFRLGVTALCVLIAVSIVILVRQDRNSDKAAATSPPTISTALRHDFLNKLRTERVNDRLKQGLRKAIRIDLALTETAAAVRPMLRVHAIAESGSLQGRRTDDDIHEVFRKSNGSLLILGEPGTGKTNLLLELVAACITEADADETAPIPLIFNLPRWTLGKASRTLEDWMIDDLADPGIYGLSRTTAEILVRRSRLTLFLDGLDEVSETRRTACVEAIHAYQQSHDLPRMVICCRLAEYEGLPRLNLRTAVRIEKLTHADVNRYISFDRMGRVRRMLEEDPELLELINTPLWLHVAMLAAEVESDNSVEKAPVRHRLYRRFVRYAINRNAEGVSQDRISDKELMKWLGWLASALKARNQSQFSLEQLDYSWLLRPGSARKLRKWVGWLVVALVFALGNELVFGLDVGLGMGLVYGLVMGLVMGLGFALGENPSEQLYFDWSRLKKSGLFSMLVSMLVLGLVVLGLGGVLILGLGDLLQSRPLSNPSPNLGTLRSQQYAGTVGILGIALMGILLLGRYAGFLKDGGPYVFRLLTTLVFLTTVTLALDKGGMFAFHHYATRFLLWKFGCAPLRYIRFLDESVKRLFLQRHGGCYEFFHLTFRDYMADTYEVLLGKQDAAPPSASVVPLSHG